MSVDPSWKGMYRIGGVSFLLAVILTVVGIVSIIALGPQSGTTEATLKSLASQRLTSVIAVLPFALRTFLLIPGWLAVYFALKEVKRSYALIATAFAVLGVAVEFVQGALSNSLYGLSASYVAATTDLQRSSFVAAAEAVQAAAQGASNMAGLLYPVSALVFGLAMMKGIFHKGVAYLGIVAGILGIIGDIIGLNFFAILLLIWWVPVGYKLYRLGGLKS